MERETTRTPDVRLRLDPASLARRVFLCCVLLETALVLLDYHVNYGRLTDVGAIRRLTNIAREDGIASWFGVTQTLLVALTAWILWLLVRAAGAPRWRRIGWLTAAVLFTYMAVDDGAQLHERFGTLWSVVREARGLTAFGRFPSYDWQVLFLPVFGAFGIVLLVFLRHELAGRSAYAMVLVAVGCLVIAVGLDFVEGLDDEHPLNLYSWVVARVELAEFTQARFQQSPYQTMDHFARSAEEFLEMLAMTLFWVTFLRHLPVAAGSVSVALSAEPTH